MDYTELSDETLAELYDRTYKDWEKFKAVTEMHHKKLINLTLEMSRRMLG